MTLEITNRDGRTWPMFVVHRLLKLIGTELILSAPKYILGQKDIVGSLDLPVPSLGMRGCTVVPRKVHELNVYDIIPGAHATKSAATAAAPKKKIIFFAGGAFKVQASSLHWFFAAELANKIPNCTISLVSYPLAPKNSAPTAFAQVQQVCQTLLAESEAKNEVVIYLGDSAGGNLVLSVPLASLASDPKARAPSAILAMSPAVDLNHANPRSLEVERNDPMLINAFCKASAVGWARDWALDDARISPIKADVTAFVKRGIKVNGCIGRYDVLAPDAELFMHKCKDAGVSGKWLVWDKQMHDFPLAFVFGLYESVQGKDWIVQTLIDV